MDERICLVVPAQYDPRRGLPAPDIAHDEPDFLVGHLQAADVEEMLQLLLQGRQVCPGLPSLKEIVLETYGWKFVRVLSEHPDTQKSSLCQREVHRPQVYSEAELPPLPTVQGLREKPIQIVARPHSTRDEYRVDGFFPLYGRAEGRQGDWGVQSKPWGAATLFHLQFRLSPPEQWKSTCQTWNPHFPESLLIGLEQHLNHLPGSADTTPGDPEILEPLLSHPEDTIRQATLRLLGRLARTTPTSPGRTD